MTRNNDKKQQTTGRVHPSPFHKVWRQFPCPAHAEPGIWPQEPFSEVCLNILEGEVAVNPASSSAMMTVSSLAASYPLNGLRGNLYKASISMFMAEVLFRVLRDGANEEGLYDWCIRKILLLDAMDGNFSNFHLLFLLELTSVLGFRPEFSDLAPFVSAENAAAAESLMRLPFEEAMLVPMTGAVRSDLIESFLSYMEIHLEYPLNIRSASVLKDLF